jgi:hypothetical protein
VQGIEGYTPQQRGPNRSDSTGFLFTHTHTQGAKENDDVDVALLCKGCDKLKILLPHGMVGTVQVMQYTPTWYQTAGFVALMVFP